MVLRSCLTMHGEKRAGYTMGCALCNPPNIHLYTHIHLPSHAPVLYFALHSTHIFTSNNTSSPATWVYRPCLGPLYSIPRLQPELLWLGPQIYPFLHWIFYNLDVRYSITVEIEMDHPDYLCVNTSNEHCLKLLNISVATTTISTPRPCI